MRSPLALMILLAAAPALACSCAPRNPAAPGPEVLVTAQVLTVTPGPTAGTHVATLRVLRRHAGSVPRIIRVGSRSHSVACGVDFTKGETRQFALYRARGRLTSNACYMFQHTRP
ncbi:MAG TPA: hypothetical protein PLQ11_11575 [Beijerinckiaceae bacterium]|nr:hypothetical protein [Beijerinckiaceae bacterium]